MASAAMTKVLKSTTNEIRLRLLNMAPFLAVCGAHVERLLLTGQRQRTGRLSSIVRAVDGWRSLSRRSAQTSEYMSSKGVFLARLILMTTSKEARRDRAPARMGRHERLAADGVSDSKGKGAARNESVRPPSHALCS